MTRPTKKTELFFLLLSSSSGAGHVRAAEALLQAARSSRLPIRVEHYDCLDFTSKFFKRVYAGSYLHMVNRAPELWGYLFRKSAEKPYLKKFLVEFFDSFNYRKYLRFLQSSHADAVICTHFLPYISVSAGLLRAKLSIPFFAVTTDFDVHQYWIDPIVRHYFVYCEESVWQLQARGVPTDRISITGIPVMAEFGVRKNKERVRASLGLKKTAFTLMILSGGFGVGRVQEILQNTLKTLTAQAGRQFNLIVVCGKNESLRVEVEQLRFPSNVTARVCGFVHSVYDMMEAADVLISKSGGLTSAEAMAKGLPMIIVDPIPGQESRNAGIIVEHGAGWEAHDYHNLQFKLRRILNDPAWLVSARAATRTLARPDAAHDILQKVYEVVSHPTERRRL